MVDLKPRLADPSVRKLLSSSIGFPTTAKIEQACNRYLQEPSWVLMGYELDGALVGCIGADVDAPRQALIHHISVTQGAMGQGIGRDMLRHLCLKYSLRRLTAETDSDAVEFYRSCGFKVEALGEQYPGIERFRCTFDTDEALNPTSSARSDKTLGNI